MLGGHLVRRIAGMFVAVWAVALIYRRAGHVEPAGCAGDGKKETETASTCNVKNSAPGRRRLVRVRDRSGTNPLSPALTNSSRCRVPDRTRTGDLA